MNNIEHLRYTAASAGKTPEQIDAIEQSIFDAAKTLQVSADDVVYVALCTLEVEGMKDLHSTLNILMQGK